MKPILFSTPMVQAILSGNKTQTRRVIKPQPPEQFSNFGDAIAFISDKTLNDTIHCHYSSIENILWVREKFFKHENNPGAFQYFADYENPEAFKNTGWKLKPSIHMPFIACRLFLKIKSIRSE
jgi:hypothetical protein